jgi:predicted permease
MALWTEVTRRIAYLARRLRFDQELSDEIHSHIDARADDLEREGLSRLDALAKARREFGSCLHVQEETRAAWQFRWLEDVCADLRYAARAFSRNGAFALTAICCLALGIGANTSMFSVAMEVLFSEPSCRDPQSLVQLQTGGGGFCPTPQYRFLRDARVFDGLAGMNIGEVVNWRDANDSYRLAGTRVTSNFFEVTGVPVAIGRPFQSGESQVAVVTHGFWTRRLGGDPNVLGRRLVLDGQPNTIVGVLPPNHRNLAGFGFTPDVYLTMESAEYILYARLPQGMTPQAATARLVAACREMDHVFSNENRKWAQDVAVFAVGGVERLRAEGGSTGAKGGLTPIVAFFVMLQLVTGLVLLIACANVSSLLLARAFSRSRELAIRSSLGGSRGRIIRQLLAESLLLAGCGTGAGLAINIWLTRLLSGVRLPLPLPIEFLIEPDRRLLTYSIGIAVVVTLAAGLVPAIRGTSHALGGILKEHEPQVGSRRWSLRNSLVVMQLAVSIVLMCGGLLFVRNLLHARSLNPGFDTAHTVWATFRAIPASCTPERFTSLTDEALERLQGRPGIEAVSPARAVPLQSPWRVGGEVRPDTGDRSIHAQYNFNAVGPEYFRVMRIPILQGRAFLDSDRTGSPTVVVLNENLARHLFGSVSPIGHTIRLPENVVAMVVGVARNSKYFIMGEENPMALYEPYAQYPNGMRFAHFLVRARRSAEDIVHEVDRTLSALDPTAAVETKTMRDALQFSLLPSRVGASVLGAMALLGLALASVGLYGTLLYAVSRRVREIGLRMALGASPGSILRMVAGQSLLLAATGTAIGLGLSLVAVRPLSMFLVPEVRPTDAVNFVVVACGLGLVAALATISPTVRALRVDPVEALRHD